MKLFGLTITRASHYEHLVKEASSLAIANVELNTENIKVLAENMSLGFEVGFLKAKISLIECINDELQNKLRPKKTPRNPKLNRVSKCRKSK